MMRDKAEERRTERLELMRQQVKNGTLVIRKMTPEERELYPMRATRRMKSARRFRPN
jgi:hypothetical protein